MREGVDLYSIGMKLEREILRPIESKYEKIVLIRKRLQIAQNRQKN